MGHVTGKTRCPKCASRGADTRGDNLILYSDGGQHCFSCGYHVFPDKWTKLKMYELNAEIQQEELALPEDVLPLIPEEALDWFYSYGFTHGDVVANKLLWSEQEKRLIFPILDEDKNIYAWQGRYFGEEDKPKWKSKGKLHERAYVKGTGDRLVLVEDILSCWKLAKAGYKAGCLFGSNPSMELILKYTCHTSRLVWWLDEDKKRESIKYAAKCRQVGIHASNVFTVNDPKDYSLSQIQEILNV